MQHVFRNVIAAAAFIALAGSAAAQSGDWYHHRDERYRGEAWRARLFSEVREDLDHVQTTVFPSRDRHRLDRTKRDLDELQQDLANHRYEEPKLDEVIRSLHRVVADNRLSPRDRNMLNEDLEHLRDYRAHHERWGRR